MKQVLKIACAAALYVVAQATAVAAAPAAGSVAQQLEAMQKTLAAMQQQLEAQQQQIAAQQAALEALRAQQSGARDNPAQVAQQQQEQQQQAAIDALGQAATKARLAAQEQPKLSFPNNRPTITSFDGRSSIALRALVQLDTAHYSQDAAGPLSSDFRRGSVGATANRETDAARDLSDGGYFRRARFGLEGKIAQSFNYKLLLELGGAGTEGPTRINDAWMSYTGIAPFTFQFGAFAPTAGLADSTVPDDLLFIERPTSAELARTLAGADGRIAFSWRAGGARWLSALSLTGRTVNDAEVNDSQSALIGRFAGLLATGENYNVHLGANGTYVIHPPDQGPSVTAGRYAIRLRDRPELRVDSTRLIDTGSIDADHVYATGVELAANRRNWLLQAEHQWIGVSRRASTLANPHFSGYYIEGSWVITGESHRYNPATGSYQSPRPFIPFEGQGGHGAWELALRYSRADLDSDPGVAGVAPPADGIRGGVQSVTTAGLNWYPNNNVRFMFDVLHVNVSRLNPASATGTPFGAAPATPPVGSQIGQDFNAFALRSQYSF